MLSLLSSDNEYKEDLLFKKQLISYKEINDYCVTCLTPLEKEILKEIINKKNCYFTDISFKDNGKFITFFLPKFEEKYIKVEREYYIYKFTWLKANGDIVYKEYSMLPYFPALYKSSYNSLTINDYIGYRNGYGWEVINVEKISKVYDCYEKIY